MHLLITHLRAFSYLVVGKCVLKLFYKVLNDMTKPIVVLLTGAGGNIGREILEMLIDLRNQQHKYVIRVFDLNNSKNREFFDRFTDIEVFLGDITHKEDLEEATKGVDVVIHMASVIPPLAHEQPKLAHNVNVNGTKNLVHLLEEYSPNAFIAIASSVATYGDRLHTPHIKVGDPLIPAEGDNYAATKIEMEKIVQSSKLRWTIYRLAAIMGVGNHHVGKLMFRMPLEQVMEIATPTDTARAFVNTLEHLDEVEGKIFNLGGGPECTTTYREFLETNFKLFGLAPFDFPERAFATQNFHCGYYEDGDKLDDIVHFRQNTLADYYRAVEENTSWVKRAATKMVSKVVKSYLLSKSEPYKAWSEKDQKRMDFYFSDGGKQK